MLHALCLSTRECARTCMDERTSRKLTGLSVGLPMAMAMRLKIEVSGRGPAHTRAVLHTWGSGDRCACARTLRLIMSRYEHVRPSALGAGAWRVALQHTSNAAARGPGPRALASAHDEPRLLLVEASHVCNGHFFVRLMHRSYAQSRSGYRYLGGHKHCKISAAARPFTSRS